MSAPSPQSTSSPQHSHPSNSAPSATATESADAASALTVVVDGKAHVVQATPDTPLLYVLRNELNLTGPRYGCGLAQCGACAVLVDGAEVRSCITPVSAGAGKKITTIEGLPALWAESKSLPAEAGTLHPVQQAWI